MTSFPYFSGLPDSSVGKESSCNAGVPGLIPVSDNLLEIPTPAFWVYLVVQLVKNLPAMWETWVQSLVWDDLWGRDRLPTPVFWPGEFHGLDSPWGCKESDMTVRLSLLASLLLSNQLLKDYVVCTINKALMFLPLPFPQTLPATGHNLLNY